MKGTQYLTQEDVLRRAKELEGIPLGQIDKSGRLKTGKGAIGTVIEESWYGYTPNNESEPDFPEAGVELKVTPYVRTHNGISAKERLVCNIIDYMEEWRKTFHTSSFWHKCNTMLLMSYESKKDVSKEFYQVDASVLFSFPETDLAVIKQDWEIINQKIRNGEAHTITEGDTMYLAACTKGSSALSVRRQPFSPTLAKQRAYSLKTTYMTSVLRRYIFGDEGGESIIKDWHDLADDTLEDYIIKKIIPYLGLTQKRLKQQFKLDSDAKNLNELLLARMLGVTGRISQSEEFQKAGIVPKTIRVQPNGRIKESMSFPCFDFIELSKEESWEDSELYNYLAPTRFMFVIFLDEGKDSYVFKDVRFWNIPAEDLEEVRTVWEKTVATIREGVVLTETPNGISNNLPKQSENRVAHVRPHGHDSSDKLPLPDGRMMTKQCFWLNNTYIAEQINK